MCTAPDGCHTYFRKLTFVSYWQSALFGQVVTTQYGDIIISIIDLYAKFGCPPRDRVVAILDGKTFKSDVFHFRSGNKLLPDYWITFISSSRQER